MIITKAIGEHTAMTKTLTLLALASTLMAGSAAAQRSPAPSATHSSRDPLTLDVAGVRLGMKRTDVQAALANKYQCSAGGRQDTFAQKVEDGVKARNGQSSGRWGGGLGIAYERCRGQNGQELTIYYSEAQAGPVVNEMRLSLRHERFDAVEMRKALLAKFGPPSIVRHDGGSWCAGGYRCEPSLSLVEGPEITLNDDTYAVVVEGNRGSRAREADRAALAAAIERLAPKKSNAAF